MILSRVEKDNIVKVQYTSSNILSSEYNKQTKKLIIVFSDGRKYQYSDVKATDYIRFETSDSQGKVFHERIKQHNSVELEQVNTNLLVEELQTLKKAELKRLMDELISVMSNTVTLYNETQLVTMDSLSNISQRISQYIKEKNT